MNIARRFLFAGTAVLLAATASSIRSENLSIGESKANSAIERLLSLVPHGATWQDLDPKLREDLERRAALILGRDRRLWGLSGLQQKEDILLSAPTAEMVENIDRILSVTFAPELPGGFKMGRDVVNLSLKRQLLRIYLAITDERGFMPCNFLTTSILLQWPNGYGRLKLA
jgi:hypothetical protein